MNGLDMDHLKIHCYMEERGALIAVLRITGPKTFPTQSNKMVEDKEGVVKVIKEGEDADVDMVVVKAQKHNRTETKIGVFNRQRKMNCVHVSLEML